MGRRGRILQTDSETHKKLLKIADSRIVSSREIQRARLILACLASEPINKIAVRLSTSPSTVIRWKNRFLESGLAGLVSYQSTGRPPKYSDSFKTAVLKKLEEKPPEGYTQWDGVLLAKELGSSKDAVWRLLRELKITLARKRK